jgi:hypothetical protein
MLLQNCRLAPLQQQRRIITAANCSKIAKKYTLLQLLQLQQTYLPLLSTFDSLAFTVN